MFEKIKSNSLIFLYRKYKEIFKENIKNKNITYKEY